MTRTAREIDLTEGTIWKQLTRFFLPIMFGSVFQQLYNTVDAIVVGRHAGTEALAAVGGTTASVINLLLGFFIGLSSGATVLLSQYIGAGEQKETHDTVHTAAALSFIFGAILTVIGVCFSPVLLRWMNTPADVMDAALIYIRIYFAGMIPSLIYNIGSALLRAVGDSKRPLYFLIAASLVNIVLDLLFVAVLRMDVAGAALATVLSQLVSAVLIAVTLIRSNASYRLIPRHIRIEPLILRKVFRIGLPSGLQSTMYSLSNVIIQVAINGFGSTVLAAWTVYSKQDFLFWMIVNALGIAITTFVGQNFGAGRIDRLKRGVRVCLAMAFAATVVICAAMLIWARQLYAIFTTDPDVIARGIRISWVLVPTYVTYLCIEIYSGALRGLGDTLLPTIFTVVGICLLRTLWVAVVCPIYNSLDVVLLSYPITWVITSALFVFYWKRRKWPKGVGAEA